jgi:hypothetical protein
MILIAAHHAAPTTCTPRDQQTRFSKQNEDKRKTKQNYPASNSNLAKSMTHHNQTKELMTWILNLSLDESIPLGFSISPLMGPLTTKVQSLKFKSKTP